MTAVRRQLSPYRRLSSHLPGILPGALVCIALLFLAALLLYQLTALPAFSSLSLGPRFARTLGWTTLQATVSTLLSVLIGCAIAWALSHQQQFPGRGLLIALLSSALVLPTLVVVLGLVTVLGRNGWLNQLIEMLFSVEPDAWLYGFGGIVIAHCYFNASFAARALLTRFDAVPEEQHKLAKSLGLGTWQRFKLIEWPAIATGIPALATTIFLLCFTSFAIVLILGGSPKYNTLEVSIYEAIKLDFNLGRAVGLALAQLAICAILVALNTTTNSFDRLISTKGRSFNSRRDSRTAQFIQQSTIALTGTAFLLPLFAIAYDGWLADLSVILQDPRFITASLTSISVAVLSTAVVLLSSLALTICHTTLSVTQRLGHARWAQVSARFIRVSATLYLAVPALVLGFGFFLIARQYGGANNYSAATALVTANVLMVLPFALVTLLPAAAKAANKYDRLASSLGVSGLSRWRLVESALLRNELIYVACIAFCMSLGDLGIIALFGSQDFATLPWLLYQKMGAYRTTEAAGIALFMLMLTLTVFLLLPPLFRRNHAVN